jgi:hypothetical protein
MSTDNRCHNKGFMGHKNGGALKAEFQGKMYCTVCSPPYCPECNYVMCYHAGGPKPGFWCYHCAVEFDRIQTEIRQD